MSMLTLSIEIFVVLHEYFEKRIATFGGVSLSSSLGEFPSSTRPRGGAVDTEIRRFLRVLSEPATFHINNNNSTQRSERKAEGRENGRWGERGTGCNLTAAEG